MMKIILFFYTAFFLLGSSSMQHLRSQSRDQALRILSYNIRHGEGMDNTINLDRTANVIARTRPHLVALQEVDKHCARSGGKDIAAELGRRLGMAHRFGKFMPYQGGEYGMAILSKLPIVETLRHPLPRGAEPRCALEVKVRFKGLDLPLSLVCIHNDWTSETIRMKQIRALLLALKDRRNPVILAGDFNGEQTDASMKFLVKSQWIIIDKKGEKTFPSDKPAVEIDYFVISNFPKAIIKQRVINEPFASDHRPVFLKIHF